jgi:hypothetical protein
MLPEHFLIQLTLIDQQRDFFLKLQTEVWMHL